MGSYLEHATGDDPDKRDRLIKGLDVFLERDRDRELFELAPNKEILMATPTEPVTAALFQALSSPEPDPKVVHAAIEEVRQIASQNVIVVLGAKIDSQTARLEPRSLKLRPKSKRKGARIDDLRQVVWRVIWPLIVLLAVPVFGLLYRVLTS